MTSIGMRSLFVIAGIAAFVTVGCGKGSPLSASGSPGSILGPTLLMADGDVDPAAASAAGEFATLGKGGNGKGGGKAGADDDDSDEREKKEKGSKGADDDADVEDDDDDSDDEENDGPEHRGRGSLSGFVTAVGTNTITVRGVVVTVASTTIIRHGHRSLTLANITVGDKVQVKGTSTTTATGTTFTASEIKVEDMDGEDRDDDASETEGAISALAGTCPALTFNAGTTKVTTNASTAFDDGGCTDVANGKTAKVTGTVQADGSILATKVDLESDDEVEGAVSGLSGTCPALTFTVATKTIKTNSSTTFEGVACTAIAAGSVVEVKGTAQADGSILATNVEPD